MEQTVNLQNVQSAILHLKKNGERVSRRNVRSITGGGMTTVHRLMSEIEDSEAFRASVVKEGLSDRLHSAILTEIAEQMKLSSEKLQEQISQLQNREAELLESLTETEARKDILSAELKTMTHHVSQLQHTSETAEKVAQETISRLEKNVSELQLERNRLTEEKEALKIEMVKAQYKIEAAEQASITTESRIARLVDEMQKQLEDTDGTI